ncbi:MAG: hypothetical protein OXT49_00135 [Gammaproteobacteria bacterium]|nr:hypothetical protein [Gammaproteobacteria bacterium]
MDKQKTRNFVAKHARQRQRATVFKDKKREAKKRGAYSKRRFGSESPFLLRGLFLFSLD